MNVKRFALGCAVVLGLNASVFAGGTLHDVSVGPGFTFTPADITITEGDTIRWTWNGGNHDVESGVGGNPDGNFDSGAPTDVNGTEFQLTFDQAFLDANPMPGDVYPYYCSIHVGVGMTGSVTVEPGPSTAIPAVGEWGMIIMLAALLAVGTVVMRNRKAIA
ncbi:MAG: cupredoxin domain-containing protein [Planctomycetota bacterium]